ncbi:MAG: glycosyl hydrolase, partial [Actinomycetota bacterium]|nr:glycosyl hydrolase [Actinomycetota bacterium]
VSPTAGNLVVVYSTAVESSLSSISGGGVTNWHSAISQFQPTAAGASIWWGQVATTGPSTVSLAYGAGPGAGTAWVQEYTAGAGTTWSLDTTGENGSSSGAPSTISFASLTPSSSSAATAMAAAATAATTTTTAATAATTAATTTTTAATTTAPTTTTAATTTSTTASAAAPTSSASSPATTTPASGAFLAGDSKTNCIYPDSNFTDLAMLSNLVGTTYNCVLLFNDAKPDWQTWTNVWWLSPPSSDSAWLTWLNAQPGRRLVISQPMVPSDAPSNWAVLGAEGQYNQYATQLATNLVSEGMGNSIIRLGWEANDPSNYENALPADSTEYADWATYWDNIVTAMRAVPGANFQFDWTINQYYQPIPLQDWYPGDRYVDIIGIDAYDSGIYQTGLTAEQRWQQLYNEPDGLAAIAAFAEQHAKPLSIPEWGLATSAVGGAGDDPTYVQGLGNFIATHDVEFNSYFYSYSATPDNMVYLPNAPQSLAAYQEYFPGIAQPA